MSIEQSLKQLNINLKIQKLVSSEYFPYQFGGKIKDGKRDYDILPGKWVSDFPDPAGTLVPMYQSTNKGSGSSNAAAYTNSKVDKLLDQQTFHKLDVTIYTLVSTADIWIYHEVCGGKGRFYDY